MQKVFESLDEVKNFIQTQKPDGFLTQDLQVYLDCLNFDDSDLKQVLIQDEGHWSEELSKAKNEAQRASGPIKQLLERQKAELENLIASTLQQEPTKGHLRMLKKLPLWGENVPLHSINFEWPTPDMLQ